MAIPDGVPSSAGSYRGDMGGETDEREERGDRDG